PAPALPLRSRGPCRHRTQPAAGTVPRLRHSNTMMRTLIVFFAVLANPVFAQDQGIQRELMLRQQNTDAFQLQLRQSQDRLQVAPGDLKRLQEFDVRQLSERQLLDRLSDRQLSEIRTDTPQELRPHEL